MGSDYSKPGLGVLHRVSRVIDQASASICAGHCGLLARPRFLLETPRSDRP